MSLEALLALLQNPPPVGAMPQLGINCLRLAGRALVQPPVFEGSGAGEEQGWGARVASNNGRDPTVLEHLPAIQVLYGMFGRYWVGNHRPFLLQL